MSSRISLSTTTAIACAVLLTLAGCTGDSDGSDPQSVAEDVRSGVPDTPAFADADAWPEGDPVPGWIREPMAGWIDEGERFAVVTWWSSSCPLVADSLDSDGADRLSVHFALPDYDACTDDLSPLTHIFVLPEDISVRPVTLTVSGDDERQPVALTLD